MTSTNDHQSLIEYHNNDDNKWVNVDDGGGDV